MDSLSAKKIASLLGGAYSVTVTESADSTNTQLLEAAKNGAPAGTILAARRQSAGRGRCGRSFCSKPGGLYMSLLLRPQLSLEKARCLTPLAAVAVAEAAEALTGRHLLIKWVNDLFWDGKKVCGILTEALPAAGDALSLSFAVIGVGLNVYAPKDGFGAGLESTATSLFPAGEYRDGLLNRLAAEIARRILTYAENPQDEALYRAYKGRLFILDKALEVRRGRECFAAKATALNRDFSLEVKTACGEILTLSSGEVSLRV